MEILEHFAIDPLFFLAEAARTLRPGGRIILTTPNVTSHRGMRKMLDGNAPYSFGVFVPTGGVYGRHNREYAPHEVAHLCEAAGFTTERLLTADVYDDHIDPEVAALLADRGSFEMRGETIFYVGRLEAHRPPQKPENLYHGDPRQMSGKLRRLGHDPLTGSTQISISNHSQAIWPAQGVGSVSLFLEWADARGTIRHSGGQMALVTALDRGKTTEINLSLDPGPPDASKGTISVELYQADAGRMMGAGRANRLHLPCSEDAFLRIVRGSA